MTWNASLKEKSVRPPLVRRFAALGAVMMMSGGS
jgi:hypothetical protein